MAKTVKVEKEIFEATLRKMLNARPTPKADLPKSRKKLKQIVDPSMIR